MEDEFKTYTPAERAIRELQKRALNERCRYYTPNGKIEQYLSTLDKPAWNPGDINIFILRAGNGVGKSAFACNLVNYLCRPNSNKYLTGSKFLREFKRPNRGRIYTTGNAAATTYQDEIQKWFISQTYGSVKGGYRFDSVYTFKSKSVFDIFTFDRDPIQGESTSLDWVVIDEPIPSRFWSGIITRLRFGGPIFIIMTALEGAGWISTLIETEKRVGRDVFVTEVCLEDACIEHGVRGHLPHAFIENVLKNCDEDEIQARVYGKYLTLAGAIFKKFGPDHIKPELIKYWQDCITTGHINLVNIVDPHPRKPFAIGWYWVFPNDDVVTCAEFPDDSYAPYHTLKSADLRTEDYADIVKATEVALGRTADRRLMDPNMGNSPEAMGDITIKQRLADFGLVYQDPLDGIVDGHQAVKSKLGNPGKGVRPSLYVLDHCANHIFGAKNYAWKESRGEDMSEKPSTVYDDFATLWRYGCMSGFKYYPPREKRGPQPKPWLPRSMRKGH